MGIDETELREIRHEVDRRLLWRGLLMAHSIIWVFGSGLAIVINNRVGVPLTIGWFGLLMLHWLVAGLIAKRNKDVQREISRRYGIPVDEKLKHDRLYRLSEDGELEAVDEDETALPPEVKQRNQYR